VVVHVTGVRLGLQLFSTYQPAAPAYLVPSYLFTTEDGGELPVIAVDETYLGPAPKPVPVQPDSGTTGEPGTVEPVPGVEPSGPATTEPATTETTRP
jgi:hypothetical protein